MIDKVKNHLNIARLFVKGIFGENSASQSEELNVWVKAHKHVANDIYNWDNYTERNNKISKINTDQEWKSLKGKLNTETPVRRFGFGQMVKYAAVAVLFIAIGLYYFTFNEKEEVQIAQTQEVIKENPKGVKSQIQLPDGTHVWLNAASSISYQAGFSDSARLITLKGEAYFEVVKDLQRPFMVTSGQITTTALGTSFNINAYEDNDISISLNTGKVDVTRSDKGGHVILLPGEQANANPSGLSVLKFDKENVLAWKDGTIHFDNTDFDEMISVLEKWYDVSLVVEGLTLNKRKTLKVTGKFKNQTLASVLKLLSHSMNFSYTIDQNIVTLKFL